MRPIEGDGHLLNWSDDGIEMGVRKANG